MITIPVAINRELDFAKVGRITKRRASTMDGLNINHEYLDLRGKTLNELCAAIDWEAMGFCLLENANTDSEAVAVIDDSDFGDWGGPEVEFGVVSIVYGLSALGCVPITSCRGRTLEDGFPHQQEYPSVSFYLNRTAVMPLLQIAESLDLGFKNDEEGMVELYSGDLKKMLSAAMLIRDSLSPRSD